MIGTKQERLKAVFDYLKGQGIVHKQADLAEKLGVDKSNISHAMNGNERYLTNSFLIRLNKAFNNIFSDDWLVDGTGDMLAPVQQIGNISNSNVAGVNVNGSDIYINPNAYEALLKIVEKNQKATEKFQEQIDRLLTIIENNGTKNR